MTPPPEYLIARLVARLFEIQNRLVALTIPRLAQHIRCRTSFGHFHKWYLGDGSNCWWCKQCREHPWLQKIIPYRWEYKEME